MLAGELKIQLLKIQNALSNHNVSLKIEHDNLEIVFVYVGPEGITVSDARETFSYLHAGKDDNYVAVNEIDVGEIRKLCDSFEVNLIETSENVPELTIKLKDKEDVPSALTRMADAIEAIFDTMRSKQF